MLQFLPSDVTNDFIANYITVKNGGEVTINIPFSEIVLNYSGNEISWAVNASSYFIPNNTFQIFSTNSAKKPGDMLNYAETFYITFSGQPIFYDPLSERLVIDKDKKSIFKLIPQVEVSYCNGNDCKKTFLNKTEMKEFDAFYKGKKIYRSPICWNICNSGKNIVLLTVCLVVITLCIWTFYRLR